MSARCARLPTHPPSKLSLWGLRPHAPAWKLRRRGLARPRMPAAAGPGRARAAARLPPARLGVLSLRGLRPPRSPRGSRTARARALGCLPPRASTSALCAPLPTHPAPDSLSLWGLRPHAPAWKLRRRGLARPRMPAAAGAAPHPPAPDLFLCGGLRPHVPARKPAAPAPACVHACGQFTRGARLRGAPSPQPSPSGRGSRAPSGVRCAREGHAACADPAGAWGLRPHRDNSEGGRVGRVARSALVRDGGVGGPARCPRVPIETAPHSRHALALACGAAGGGAAARPHPNPLPRGAGPRQAPRRLAQSTMRSAVGDACSRGRKWPAG